MLVEGRVTLHGKPVTRGSVIFQPESIAQGALHPAHGRLAADGTYRMSTFAEGDGVTPGQYKVAVRSIVRGPTPEEPATPFVYAVPEKYVTPATSGLTASIPADGPARLAIDFELK